MPDRSWALQRKLLRAPGIGFNAEIQRWFKDVETVSVNRTKLRDSLLIQKNESRTSAMFKIQFFRDSVQKVHDHVTVLGEPQDNFETEHLFEFHPQVTLYFEQDREAVPDGYEPIRANISFRLMDETTETITKSNVETLAKQIRTELATGQGYTFDKGKYLCKYSDKKHGYELQLYTLNGNEGEQLARKIVGIRNHTFEEDGFRVVEPKKNAVNTSSNITVLGTTVKKRRWRPSAKVRFRHACLYVKNRPRPICLVDLTGTKYNPIVRAY